MKCATQIMCGVDPVGILKRIPEPTKIGVKVPQFSWNRLPGSDILLDVEMQSTGEVACFGENHYEAYLKGLLASGFKVLMPKDKSKKTESNPSGVWLLPQYHNWSTQIQ